MQPPPLSLRVLVVEDEPHMADCLALLLQRWGHETSVAYHGPGALGVVATFQPEVVLLDIGLPDMDGYEVARQLRQRPGMEKCLLVALTGHGHEDDVRRCKEAGIDCHFVKPVDPAELKEVLAKAERLGPGQRQLAC
jgi:two-component system, chemotaxis family, CheB/CheR fusion protein